MGGFPSAVDGRDVVDQDGRSWFAVGDAPWSLVGQLTDDEISSYLQDRADKGFRLVMFSAPEAYYATNAPRNISNEAAFTATAFQSALNEPYWERVDFAVDEAARLGITVLVSPAYLGCCGDGVVPAFTDATDEQVYDYGRALGQRYRDRPNIMWLAGHDTAPTSTQKARYASLQAGIQAAGDTHLWVPGGHNNDIGSNSWGSEPVAFDLDTAYDYVFAPIDRVSSAWAASQLPVAYIEGSYENMRIGGPGTTAMEELRYQAWGSFVAGAFAHIYGNDPIWHFNSLGGTAWTTHLDDPGSRAMTYLATVMAARDWGGTLADASGAFLVEGSGRGSDRAGARLSAGLALVYMPSERDVTLDLTQLGGAEASVTRIDPSNGDTTVLSSTASGAVLVPAQGMNAAGDSDWALLVETGSRPDKTSAATPATP